MKKSIFLLLGALIPFLFVGCSNENEEPNPPIALQSKSVSVKFHNSSYDINVTSKVDWVATTQDAWITLTQEGGSAGKGVLSFEVESNPALIERCGTILLTAAQDETISTTLTVNQAAKEFELAITKIGDIPSVGTKKATLKITVFDESQTFNFGFVTKSEFSNHDNPEAFMKWHHANDAKWVNTGNYRWKDFLRTGSTTYEGKGLNKDCDYVAFAYLADMEGNLISEVLTYIEFSTTENIE